MREAKTPWYRELNRYHWFVLTVAALGWLFDTMDQQLFTLARKPAMQELLAVPRMTRAKRPKHASKTSSRGGHLRRLRDVDLFDRVGPPAGSPSASLATASAGRKTMLLDDPDLFALHGPERLSRGFWDFAFYRFLTGLGVGGEFAVGVALGRRGHARYRATLCARACCKPSPPSGISPPP